MCSAFDAWSVTDCEKYGTAHEHKGPGDFNSGAMDDDDDEDMGTPPPEEAIPREHSLPPHMHNPTPSPSQLGHH